MRTAKFFLVLCIPLLLLAVCGDTEESCTVTFNTNGGTPSVIASVTVVKGETLGAKFPKSPTKDGFDFVGWWDGETRYYSNRPPVTKDLTLKARWETPEPEEGKIDLEAIFAFLDEIKDENNFTPPAGFDQQNNQYVRGTITERTYYSTTTEANRRCNVYTPPNYDPNDADTKYPVMYLLHGIGGLHTEWMGGNPNEVLSNLIGQEKAKPMIVVMPNARATQNDSDTSNNPVTVAGFHNFYNDLRDNLMPFIAENYHVLEERHNTAVAGLSMGGMTALHVGLMLPELFGYVGGFSSAPTLPQYTGDYSQMDLPDEYKNNTFILICCGTEDGLISNSRNYNKALEDNGVPTYYYERPGVHDFVFWKNGLYYFAQCIF